MDKFSGIIADNTKRKGFYNVRCPKISNDPRLLKILIIAICLVVSGLIILSGYETYHANSHDSSGQSTTLPAKNIVKPTATYSKSGIGRTLDVKDADVYCYHQGNEVKCAGISNNRSGEIIQLYINTKKFLYGCYSLIIEDCYFLENKINDGWLPRIQPNFSITILQISSLVFPIIIEDNAFNREHFKDICYFTLKGTVKYLKQNAFNGLVNLQYLDIRILGHEIEYVEAGILNSVSNVKSLQIQHNITYETFINFTNNVTFQSALTLDIRNNNFRELQSDTLEKFPELKQIFIRSSNLYRIYPDAFSAFSKSIQLIDLSYNYLENIPPGLFDVHHKRDSFIIYLNNNRLTRLSEGIFYRAINKCEKFYINLLLNNWICDCNLAWLQDMIHNQSIKFLENTPEPQCVEPEYNELISIRDADFNMCTNITSTSTTLSTITNPIIISTISPKTSTSSSTTPIVSSTKTTSTTLSTITNLTISPDTSISSSTTPISNSTISMASSITSTVSSTIPTSTTSTTLSTTTNPTISTISPKTSTSSSTTPIVSSTKTTSTTLSTITNLTISPDTSISSSTTPISNSTISMASSITSTVSSTIPTSTTSTTLSTSTNPTISTISPKTSTSSSTTPIVSSTKTTSTTLSTITNLTISPDTSISSSTTPISNSTISMASSITSTVSSTIPTSTTSTTLSTSTNPITISTISPKPSTSSSNTSTLSSTTPISSSTTPTSNSTTPISSQNTLTSSQTTPTSSPTTSPTIPTTNTFDSTTISTTSTTISTILGTASINTNTIAPITTVPTNMIPSTSTATSIISEESSSINTTTEISVTLTSTSSPSEHTECVCVEECDIRKINISITNFLKETTATSPIYLNFQNVTIEEDDIQKELIIEILQDDHILLWMNADDPNGIQCNFTTFKQDSCKTSNSYIAKFKIHPSTAYTLCAVSINGDPISPLNCRAHTTLPQESERPWLLNDNKTVAYSIFVSTVIASIIFGGVIIYILIRRYPRLIKGNKRVIIVSQRPWDVMVMPKEYYYATKSEDYTRFRRNSETSYYTARTSSTSYVTAIQPTPVQLISWKFNQMWNRLTSDSDKSTENKSLPSKEPPPLPPYPKEPSCTSSYEMNYPYDSNYSCYAKVGTDL